MILVHLEEPKFHRPSARVLMHYALDLGADLRHNSQFFLEFTAHGIAGLFAFFDLAAGKFPFKRHDLMPRPLAGEDELIFHDQRGCDSFHG